MPDQVPLGPSEPHEPSAGDTTLYLYTQTQKCHHHTNTPITVFGVRHPEVNSKWQCSLREVECLSEDREHVAHGTRNHLSAVNARCHNDVWPPVDGRHRYHRALGKSAMYNIASTSLRRLKR